MKNEVRFYKKLLVLSTIVFIISIAIIVLRYETITFSKTTNNEEEIGKIIRMIKELPDYQGDSILIDDDGILKSLDGPIQSTLIQAYVVDTNIEGIKSEARNTGLPEAFLVYRTGIKWYISQHGSRLKKPSDSLDVK